MTPQLIAASAKLKIGLKNIKLSTTFPYNQSVYPCPIGTKVATSDKVL